MTKSLLEEYAEDPLQRRLLLQESAIYEVTELLESVLREKGVNRAEFARKLGKSKGWVTQLLDGELNKTIRTVADAFAVLGREYRSFQVPIQIENKLMDTAPFRSTTSAANVVSDRQQLQVYPYPEVAEFTLDETVGRAS